ncbi:MAG TPA: SapC family protein, partial [Sphingomicrobium sp.]
MATAAPDQPLPLLYSQLELLNLQQHGSWKIRRIDKSPMMAKVHAIPATVEEFPLLQRFYPIVFSVGDNPVPLVLMGLNEGVNVFLDEDGVLIDKDVYVPAYLRRYPFLLARVRPDSDELSLCVDPSSGAVGDFE